MITDSAGNLYFADSYNVRIRKIGAANIPNITGADAAFLGRADFSSNMYLDISGTNLSQTTRAWNITDFNGASAPVSIDGVSVSVNGEQAFIRYVSPTQVGIITPDDSATGTVSIQLQAPGGSSNVWTANRARVSPTLQPGPAFGGVQYVLARTADYRLFVGSPNIIGGSPMSAVKPGDTIVIQAVGCGPTDPAIPAGTVAPQDAPVTLPVEVRIGGVPADLMFAAMVSNSIGLYQFTVVVPNVAAGDQPIELSIDGVKNNQNLMIAIGQ
jgi:uncharacterized protein (TIGR03437 family)